MNIDIGKGYDLILFGMDKKKIKSILGTPDKIVTERCDGEEFLYNSKKIKLFFDKEEKDKLYSIEVFDDDVLFLSNKVIGMTYESFLEFMAKNGFDEYEIDEYSYFDTIYFDKCNTTFTLEFNVVKSFEFSPLFSEDGNEIIWTV